MNIKQMINGKEYDVCYPDSWYLADRICKETHEDYVLSAEYTGFVAKIFMQEIHHQSNFYEKDETHATVSKIQKCIGWLIWYPETDTVILRKTQVDSEKHEFHTGEELAISYDVFKNLRDHDIIQIHANTKDKNGKVIPMIYKIKKYKAAKLGDFKHFGSYGLQYFIPKDAFLKEVDTKAKKKKGKRKTSNNRMKTSDGTTAGQNQEENSSNS